MNLIMENWRKKAKQIDHDHDVETDMNLIREGFNDTIQQMFSKKDIETVGELRAFVKATKLKKGGSKILSTFGDLIPGLGPVYKMFKRAKGTKQAFKKLSGAGDVNDGVETNTGMDRLRIDKGYSKIVDDDIEEGFLYDFLAKLEGLPDDAQIPDANAQLEDYLKFKFDQRTVDVENEK